MADGEDWIMRPIAEGYYTLADIKSGLIDLLDVARANDAMDVRRENERRWHEANKP